jgi:Flp pilus assembly protein CpaB
VDSSGLTEVRRQVTDLLQTRRRSISALLLGLAVVSAVTALRPAPARTVTVWVAARDLPGGAPLSRADLRQVRLPAAGVPAGALPSSASPAGRLLAAPVRRGEPLTDLRLLSGALLRASGSSTDLAVPVRITDGPAALALVRAGEAVDVIAATDTAEAGAEVTAVPVVEDVRVLAVPDRLGADDAGLIIVAATSTQATALAQIPPGDRVSVALRRAS